jgi:glycosyltransferase involved in cell wall biosynthesis
MKVGILSDSPFFSTGYRNQAVNIANLLVKNNIEVYYYAHGYMGQDLQPGTTVEGNEVLNFHIIGGGREAYFKDVLPMFVKKHKIDVLIILLDTFMLYPWFMQWDLSPAKVVFYYPSDGGSGMPLGCEQILRMVTPVAMAKFGQIQVQDMYGIKSLHIPHATNINLFSPVSKEEKEKMKAKWGLTGKFVVGSVFRNQGRKMADRTIKSFALFAKNAPDAILFLHTDPNDQAQVFPIHSLVQRYGIENRVIYSGMQFYNGFTNEQMREVYNLMDVFLLTTSGEGFGIPIIEAMSTGIPCLVTNYTTTKELVIDNNAGLGINLVGTTEEESPAVHENEILDGTITGSWDVERGMCSNKDAAAKLLYLYQNPEVRAAMGLNGRKAAETIYNWNVTEKQWLALVKQLGESY